MAEGERAHEEVFGIVLAASEELIGYIGVMRGPETVGLGFWIGRSFRHRGFATEAGGAVLDWARDSGIAALTAEVFCDNSASTRVLAKLGFSSAAGEVERAVPARDARTLRRFARRL